jgi:hypothetical protein
MQQHSNGYYAEIRSESMEELLQVGLKREAEKNLNRHDFKTNTTNVLPQNQSFREPKNPREQKSTSYHWVHEKGTTYDCHLYPIVK